MTIPGSIYPDRAVALEDEPGHVIARLTLGDAPALADELPRSLIRLP